MDAPLEVKGAAGAPCARPLGDGPAGPPLLSAASARQRGAAGRRAHARPTPSAQRGLLPNPVAGMGVTIAIILPGGLPWRRADQRAKGSGFDGEAPGVTRTTAVPISRLRVFKQVHDSDRGRAPSAPQRYHCAALLHAAQLQSPAGCNPQPDHGHARLLLVMRLVQSLHRAPGVSKPRSQLRGMDAEFASLGS